MVSQMAHSLYRLARPQVGHRLQFLLGGHRAYASVDSSIRRGLSATDRASGGGPRISIRDRATGQWRDRGMDDRRRDRGMDGRPRDRQMDGRQGDRQMDGRQRDFQRDRGMDGRQRDFQMDGRQRDRRMDVRPRDDRSRNRDTNGWQRDSRMGGRREDRDMNDRPRDHGMDTRKRDRDVDDRPRNRDTDDWLRDRDMGDRRRDRRMDTRPREHDITDDWRARDTDARHEDRGMASRHKGSKGDDPPPGFPRLTERPDRNRHYGLFCLDPDDPTQKRPSIFKRRSSQPRDDDEFDEDSYSLPVVTQLPYTTPESQFLYGVSAVQGSLRAGRRTFYKLYIYKHRLSRTGSRGPTIPSRTLTAIRTYAIEAGVPIEIVGHNYLPAFDRASASRPHNGVILECAPVQFHAVRKLNRTKPSARYVPFSPAPQTADRLELAGPVGTFVPRVRTPRKYPLVLMVDSVRDSANVGTIARSAYFLGVSAIALAYKTCAPLTAITVKASSGAIESIPILNLEKPAEFLAESAKEGWFVVSTGSPTGLGGRENRKDGTGVLGRSTTRMKTTTTTTATTTTATTAATTTPIESVTLSRTNVELPPSSAEDGSAEDNSADFDYDLPLLDNGPTILIVGGEGDPVQRSIHKHAHAILSIWPACGAGAVANTAGTGEDTSTEERREIDLDNNDNDNDNENDGDENAGNDDTAFALPDPLIVDSLNVGVSSALACHWLLTGGTITSPAPSELDDPDAAEFEENGFMGNFEDGAEEEEEEGR